jgi:hypothetical protein
MYVQKNQLLNVNRSVFPYIFLRYIEFNKQVSIYWICRVKKRKKLSESGFGHRDLGLVTGEDEDEG